MRSVLSHPFVSKTPPMSQKIVLILNCEEDLTHPPENLLQQSPAPTLQSLFASCRACPEIFEEHSCPTKDAPVHSEIRRPESSPELLATDLPATCHHFRQSTSAYSRPSCRSPRSASSQSPRSGLENR